MGNSETTRFARAAGGAAQQRQCADCQQRQRRGFWNGFGELCRALIGREGEGGDIKIGGGGGERIALKEIVEREFRGENRGIAVLEEGVEVEFAGVKKGQWIGAILEIEDDIGASNREGGTRIEDEAADEKAAGAVGIDFKGK